MSTDNGTQPQPELPQDKAEEKSKDPSLSAIAENNNDSSVPDPRLEVQSGVVRDGEYVILAFGDGRKFFAQCQTRARGKSTPVKIHKRSYHTWQLVGLKYGKVLELGQSGLVPLPDGEEVIPSNPYIAENAVATVAATAATDDSKGGADVAVAEDNEMEDTTFPPIQQDNDNRHLLMGDKSQAMDQDDLRQLREEGAHGSEIVEALIENSSSFKNKTEFSKAKYILRKQKKYQPRCRMVRCTAYTICEALYIKDSRKLMNMREDTLGQILSYSNVSAGCQALVFENCMGIVTGAVAERMGGYGRILSVYTGQQPAFVEMLSRFNLTFAQSHSIKWLHSGDVFMEDNTEAPPPPADAIDTELEEREQLKWPCPLQEHTRQYMQTMAKDKQKKDFLAKRCNRFARKLTRHTTLEVNQMLAERKCDSVIIVTRTDPTATLLGLLPYLAPSGPFVVYCEFIEPLTECFLEMQRRSLAINLRLSDTWMREYQVLPGRTHPNMNISQSGGFILTGIKLCPVTGKNELDEELMKEIRSEIGGRRGRKPKKKENPSNEKDSNMPKKKRRR
ncbi:N(1)-methyltransferase non-catalytic subunit TRM6 [Seminavis robusta]|uniref:tRNA (adenine(58)-N(1))-methyltransferase non-catalytic subunit TRM6 n=1 Tax=Seminavis robusta TaxID=568900 RepID=A0A9N8HC89_9STRA|nr:N(1)-methyltransferase non-catalytic subunit TRM6 [Seminavis robusta]|eukprot:Sro371_g128510.1 N(1))-methyltransferase non-catalytic subunit TRM6 (562) ;mRNA; f:11735-13420